MDSWPLPPRVRGNGLIDTGTSMSLISEATADALSLDTLHSVELHTALSSSMAPCYAAEFQFVGSGGIRMPPLRLVVARAPNLREDMVIGLDVLRQFQIEWDGPAGTLRLWPGNVPGCHT
ncbi:retropepsin-like aspartic protease [Candidatus Poriferisodalis sp.]|uniref:retropepsin-like aspartic protease n=1 Tax=Candidatus Poriferisodalis sp. TaxID=3101277 RepID=UPI003B5CF739